MGRGTIPFEEVDGDRLRHEPRRSSLMAILPRRVQEQAPRLQSRAHINRGTSCGLGSLLKTPEKRRVGSACSEPAT